MRLKILFFPLMLVISAVVFISYVWPEIDNLKSANREKAAATRSLAAIVEKQDNIRALAAQISNDQEGTATVAGYLPDKKVEERIIGGVSYLAADSGVSLMDISLESLEPSADDAVQAGFGAAVMSSVNTLATGELPADNPAGGQIAGSADGMRYSEASIMVVGDYGKIRLFLDQLQRMPILNEVKSLSITSRAEEPTEADDADDAISTDLVAEMVVDFGYLQPAVSDNNDIARIQPQLDKDIIGTLKQYISQKTSSVAAAGGVAGSKGKTNPFLP